MFFFVFFGLCSVCLLAIACYSFFLSTKQLYFNILQLSSSLDIFVIYSQSLKLTVELSGINLDIFV